MLLCEGQIPDCFLKPATPKNDDPPRRPAPRPDQTPQGRAIRRRLRSHLARYLAALLRLQAAAEALGQFLDGSDDALDALDDYLGRAVADDLFRKSIPASAFHCEFAVALLTSSASGAIVDRLDDVVAEFRR